MNRLLLYSSTCSVRTHKDEWGSYELVIHFHSIKGNNCIINIAFIAIAFVYSHRYCSLYEFDWRFRCVETGRTSTSTNEISSIEHEQARTNQCVLHISCHVVDEFFFVCIRWIVCVFSNVHAIGCARCSTTASNDIVVCNRVRTVCFYR
jgi:hypothetical protein